MTTQKDFKRLVRGRMQKTGESYTSARAVLLRSQGAKQNGYGVAGNGTSAGRGEPSADSTGQSAPDVSTATAPAPASQPGELAKIAGMSDEAVKAKTGCTWDRWVWALDHVNAFNWPHREIARYVREKYKVPGWWSQSVTVGYERIRGLREKGQRRGGSWEASKSRTMDAAVGTVFKAFKQPKRRAGWLPNMVVERTSVPNKSLRLTWEDGTSVEVYLVSKGRSKSQVVIQHTRLPSREAAARMKAFWAEHLDLLANQLQAKQKKPGWRTRDGGAV